MTDSARVLFVCVRNSGKSQMAAALMRQLAGDRVLVTSAGTAPGARLNQESVASLAEIGASLDGEFPKQLTDEMLREADRVIVLGTEARVVRPEGMMATVEVWQTDEPSLRGITGAERMRLVRDDIRHRVEALLNEMDTDHGIAAQLRPVLGEHSPTVLP